MDARIEKYIAETLGIDDPELRQELFESYCRTLTGALAEMTPALECGNFAKLKLLGHKIKGSALTIGHSPVHRAAVAIENAALAGDKSAVRAGLEELRQLIAELSGVPAAGNRSLV